MTSTTIADTAAPATTSDAEPDDTLTSAAAADTASDLLGAMAAMPAGHPSRPALRDRAIEAWLPLAKHLAHRYANRGEPTDDLIQTANIGLIKAVDRFDPDRGVDFAGYAIPTIIGEIKRHFRDRTWSIRVPRRLQELRLQITEANANLTHTLGRSPLVTDIATHLGVTEEEVLEGLEGARAYNATSLSTPLGTEGTTELGDTIADKQNDYELADLRATLEPALGLLDDRERRIVILRFYGNQTQTQIAEQVGVSQMHVSRLLTRALAKLRTTIAADTL
ncbi:SigB/SigF/SigG family RNA polymerase sigma factor [Actinoplanes sp. NPDC049118]|uniref:SigB/SigF/SigG family RNA polymerase sigma factor n=1 Tax=Actinoplanes sp. NPDC049118 TaxID=3155769 RepID=UPI0034063C3D